MNDDLSQLSQEPNTVTVGSTVITVREVHMKELGAFTRACAPFLNEFSEGGLLSKPNEFALFRVLSDHAENMVLAASLVSNAPVEFLERMKPDDFFRVAAKVIEVNGNFFVRRLAPQLIKFAEAMGLVGTMLSSTSLEPGTDTPT